MSPFSSLVSWASTLQGRLKWIQRPLANLYSNLERIKKKLYEAAQAAQSQVALFDCVVPRGKHSRALIASRNRKPTTLYQSANPLRNASSLLFCMAQHLKTVDLTSRPRHVCCAPDFSVRAQ